MNYINYRIFRILTLIVFTLVFVLILLLLKRTKSKRILIVLYILLYFIYLSNSFESLLIKFKSLDGISNFFEPKQQIIKKYEFDDYAYIIYGKDGYFHIRYYKKKLGYWKIGNTKFGNLKYKSFKINNIIFYIYSTENKETLIIINYFIQDNKEAEKIINKTRDSLYSNIKTKVYKEKGNKNDILQIIKIDEKINDNYKIYVNDIEYSLSN